jgi:hypothetical protein
MSTKSKGVPCYDNAGENEPIFVLRAQDVLAPELVREWAFRAAHAGTPTEKVAEARMLADTMDDWQIANMKKVPD